MWALGGTNREARGGLPPGPCWPLPLQSLLVVFNAERYVSYCLRRFDGMVTLRIAGCGKAVVIFGPELTKELFTGDPEQFCGGQAASKFLRTAAGPNSLLVKDGEEHMRMRRLLLPPFHGEAVRGYSDLVAQLTADEVERWPIGVPLAVYPSMLKVTLEVVLRSVIGVRDERRLERFRVLTPRVLRAHPMAFWLENTILGGTESSLVSRLPWIAARREVGRLIRDEIADHRAEGEGRTDVLAMLMAVGGESGPSLSDDELYDQIMTLLIVGHETTSASLAWCFERLVRHPHCLQRLLEEIEADEGEEYLEAVVNETLRTRPVLDQVLRTLSSATEIGGYTLPAGTTVAASILGMHRSAAHEDALEFRPERFLGRSPDPYTFIPFGGGVRRCVGASFATMQMKTVLRTVLQRVQLQTAADRPERAMRWRTFTASPQHGGRVVVSARKAAEPVAAPLSPVGLY